MRILRLATRHSPLAIKQSLAVKEALERTTPDLEIKLIKMKTQGDIITDKPLADIGGKGLFLKELQEAILNDEADFAVHSMKDVPVNNPASLCVYPVLRREYPADVFVSLKYNTLSELPEQSIIGTSSPRRKGQILALRNDIIVRDCRGNVGTRLKKLANREFSAIILAAAGLKRLNQLSEIKQYFNFEEMLPAATQGILAVEFRKTDLELNNVIKNIIDEDTQLVCTVERSFLKEINGDCHTPIAAFCKKIGRQLILRVGFYLEDGSLQFLTAQTGGLDQAAQLGIRAANNIKSLAGPHLQKHIE
jgi:hydroxymethylbilane synthase